MDDATAPARLHHHARRTVLRLLGWAATGVMAFVVLALLANWALT